ncbi:UNVERIFIED_CONTAM: hypothetical protein RMT77_019516 [Armadillidium vulgare]
MFRFSLLVGLWCFISPLVSSDPSAVVEDGASLVLDRKGNFLDLFEKNYNPDEPEFNIENTDPNKEISSRARFLRLITRTSQTPYEILIDCLIVIIPQKIDTLQDICGNLQILMDLRIRERTINFDALASALMRAITMFLNTLEMSIRNLQMIGRMAPRSTAGRSFETSPTGKRRPRLTSDKDERDKIYNMIQETLKEQQSKIKKQQESHRI